MNRRRFLKASALTAAPLVINRIPVYAGNSLPDGMLKALATTANLCNRVLVIVQMNGGNDGINTVIPVSAHSQLASVRGDLNIPLANLAATTLPATAGSNGTSALHPSMTGMFNLYTAGKMAIVQGVSYPVPSYSHFQAQDIWFTGVDTLPSPNTGWLGNALATDYPNYPNGYPNSNSPHPLAIQIGGALPLSLQGPNINMGYNVPSPTALQQIANNSTAAAPASDYGTELTFLRMMKQQSNAYATAISTAYNTPSSGTNTNLSTMYAASSNALSDQLKIVARLIRGGLTTPIYVVNQNETYDLHVNQVAGSTGASSPTTGAHATALSKLSVAISAFMDDINLMGHGHRVLGMTFSEFGRRVSQNTSVGTDHGSAAPVMLFGNTVQGGMVGHTPSWTGSITGTTQAPTQHDFRQIYATIMQQWMCLSPATSSSILGGTFATLPLFNNVALAGEGITLKAGWQGDTAALEVRIEGAPDFRSYALQRSYNGADYHTVSSLDVDLYKISQIVRITDWAARETTATELYYRVRGVKKAGGELLSNTTVLSVAPTESQAVRIFPNPVRGGRINVEFIKPVDGEVHVAMYDAHGAKIFTDQRRPQGSYISLQVPPEDYDAHTLYFLKLIWDGREIVEKLTFE